ncbi:IclR family transcriptional regulator [Amycolatopsis jejuensis]|uniref:IclR family transcriptional regulator n=1 Tax=Amycolatopsis jejuensis TaxID=330084 RepID=UPI001B805B66|nr:IclR family transcriptional regulator [Amycolatopsis jejuensis]
MESRVIQSVQRAFGLLEHVAASGDGVRLSELADRAGLNRSTTHNLLASLEELGYVMQQSRGAPYRLTAKLGRLVRSDAEAEYTLRARVRPVLAEISRETGETAYLAFAAGMDYLCAEAVQSDKPLHHAVTPGDRDPLLGTAIGHVLLANDPDLARATQAQAPKDWSQYAGWIAETGTSGYALDLDEFLPGVSCVAVAIGSRAAVGITGPSSRLSEARLRAIAQRIRQVLPAV